MYTGGGSLFFVCAVVYSAFGVQLPSCFNGRLTINEKLPSIDILCEQINTNKQMFWSLSHINGNIGYCEASNVCISYRPNDFNFRRSGEVCNITIPSSQYSNIGNSSIICSEADIVPATCNLNVVYPPDVTCTASFTSGSWTLNMWCNVTKTYSSRDTYWCTAYRGTTQDSQTTLIDNKSYSPTAHSQVPYRQGTCSFTVNKLGGDTIVPGNSQLYFRVDVYPGPTPVVIQEPLTIVRPASPTIKCPDIVEENATFTCTCTTSTIGQPPGRLRWSGPASVSVTGNYGDSSLDTPSLTLTRQDHNITRLTCEVMWAEGTYSQYYAAKVGYKPENLILMINSTSQSNVTVNENETVTFTCQADARPVSTVVLEKEGDRLLATSQSPLVHMVGGAQCQDTGRYRCSAKNTYGQSVDMTRLLFVKCSPRKDTAYLGQLNFQNRSTHISFNVTAYPLPSIFSFTYTGINGTDPPQDSMNIDLSAYCTSVFGLITFNCIITVYNVTSPSAQGHYVVTVGNSVGQQNYTFYLLYNGPTPLAPNNDEQSGGINAAAVGGGIGGAVAVLIVVVVIVVIFLRRRNASPDKERLNVSIKPDNGNHTKTQGPVNPPDQPLSFTPCALQNAGDQQCETLQQANHAPHSSQAQHKKPQKSKPTDKAKTKKKNKGAKEDDTLHVYGNMPLTQQKMKQQSPQELAAAKPKKEGEGLIYSELDFQGKPSVQAPVQKDSETVIYSDIKVSVTVNPHNA